MTQLLPLFPLSTVLFPHSKMPLQIFEPRYLDLVKSSLRNNEGFGIVLLRSGGETVTRQHGLKVEDVGTVADIVDWDQLDNGMLGVTVAGRQSFRLIDHWQTASQLHMATIELIDLPGSEVVTGEHDDLNNLILQLAEHPQIAKLNLDLPCKTVDELGCLLAQLLPLENAIKYPLLLQKPAQRLESLIDILNAITG